MSVVDRFVEGARIIARGDAGDVEWLDVHVWRYVAEGCTVAEAVANLVDWERSDGLTSERLLSEVHAWSAPMSGAPRFRAALAAAYFAELRRALTGGVS